ncbi:hypothetical protein ACHAPA_002043 [Fusarium lateritium]
MAQPGDTTLSPGFQALPTELVGAICGLLSNSDIKSLRLTCRYLRDKSRLRFDRVFISANPRNIEVLLAIANHDVFRGRHFGLLGMQVSQDDLISFLAKLPSTLQSVELSFLSMIEGDDYAGLLTDIRDRLGWRHRPSGQRIQVSISVTTVNIPYDGRYICLDKEVQEYNYGDGPSPFHFAEGISESFVPFGTGTIQDEFDPNFKMPYGRR